MYSFEASGMKAHKCIERIIRHISVLAFQMDWAVCECGFATERVIGVDKNQTKTRQAGRHDMTF